LECAWRGDPLGDGADNEDEKAVGPILFSANDAPYYVPGVRGCLGILAAQLALVIINVRTLVVLNRVHRLQRVANDGLPK
jgi:hypothetical protein